jgi:hypothetical protein
MPTSLKIRVCDTGTLSLFFYVTITALAAPTRITRPHTNLIKEGGSLCRVNRYKATQRSLREIEIPNEAKNGAGPIVVWSTGMKYSSQSRCQTDKTRRYAEKPLYISNITVEMSKAV